jgi:adenine deaminase
VVRRRQVGEIPTMALVDRLAAARGDRPADLVFRGGRVVNVLTGEIETVDVAVHEGIIVGLGPGYEGVREEEVGGRYVLPGLVDAHVHIESSLVTPPEFARAVLPHGTTTVVADPHEIANVHGSEGIRYMLDASEAVPLSVLIMASSCVPATPMGTAGAELGVAEMEALARHPRVLGLAEVMNFPGVVQGDPEVLAKIAVFQGRPVDGHAPGVTGQALNAYILAGPGSDHECTTPGEATEKLRRGLVVFLREATNAHNLLDLLPALTPRNRARVALCTDDRQPADLLDEGGIDAMVRALIAAGLDPLDAIGLGTLNPCAHYGLRDRGAVAPGRRADLVVTSDLQTLPIEEVWVQGRRVAREGVVESWPRPRATPPPPSMRVAPDEAAFRIPASGDRVRVIGLVADQIVTRSLEDAPTVRDGVVVADPTRDLLKIAVLERHRGTGRVGLGLVKGIGLKAGAIAGTVAHDHHNLVVVGADDRSMMTAASAVADLGGGLAVARDGSVLATLALRVGGLMSEDPIETVREGLDGVVGAARTLGSGLHDPFMAMSFLALEVIPSLKITDQGLVDVDRFRAVPLFT